MAELTTSKTWQFKVNVVQPFTSTNYTYRFRPAYEIKQVLVGNGSWTDSEGDAITPSSDSSWEVIGSSNSSTSGMDGVDRWTTSSVSSGARWIVLESPLNFQLLLSVSSLGILTISMSLSGFGSANGGSDGTPTTPPTGSGTIAFNSFNAYSGGDPSNLVLHSMKSDDGYHTRVVILKYGEVYGAFIVDKLENTSDNWNEKFVVRFNSLDVGSETVFSYNYMSSTSNRLETWFNGSRQGLSFTGEMALNNDDLLAYQLNSVNDISGAYSVYPIGVGNNVAPNTGRYGDVVDMWWGTRGITSYSSYPGDDSKQFIQFTDVILPWNKSNILLI